MRYCWNVTAIEYAVTTEDCRTSIFWGRLFSKKESYPFLVNRFLQEVLTLFFTLVKYGGYFVCFIFKAVFKDVYQLVHFIQRYILQ
ncbi:MAG: hypothetical protein CSA26_00655 [Desulfobacterales bacterium]|nr:MAG: hypothetical protein CSA26_00655 [Desulfobacterales bacterium]